MSQLFDSDNFQQEVLDSPIPVVVDFYTPQCGPCQKMAPLVDRLAEEFDGEISIGKCDASSDYDLASTYKIYGVPTVVSFKDGKEVARHVGLMNESQFREFLSKTVQ